MNYGKKTYLSINTGGVAGTTRKSSTGLSGQKSRGILSFSNRRNGSKYASQKSKRVQGTRQGIFRGLTLCIFSFTVLICTDVSAKIRDIKIDPIHHTKVHNFKINPGVPLTITFPHDITEAVYGDGINYKIVKIDSRTISVKVKNLNTAIKNNDNGFTVILDTGNKISFILQPTSDESYDVVINFYEGALPQNSKLAKKSKELESEYEKRVEEYETSFNHKVDEYVSEQLQKRGSLKNLKGEKRTHGITYQSKKRFTVGDRVYYLFSIENNKYEKILPEDVEFKSFYLKGGKTLNIKLVDTVKFCEKKILDRKEETLCTFSYQYPEDSDLRHMLHLITPSLKQAQMILLK